MERMFEDYEKKKRSQHSQMRSMKDYGMGVFILFIGLFFLFRNKLGKIPLNESLGQPDTLEKIFGGLCIIYGVWRFYRGYKKNYFK